MEDSNSNMDNTTISTSVDGLLPYYPAIKRLMKCLDVESIKALSMVSIEWLHASHKELDSRCMVSIPKEKTGCVGTFVRDFTNVTINGNTNLHLIPSSVRRLTLCSVNNDATFDMNRFKLLNHLILVDSSVHFENSNSTVRFLELKSKFKCYLKVPLLQRQNMDKLNFINLDTLKVHAKNTGSLESLIRRHPTIKSFALASLHFSWERFSGVYEALRDCTRLEQFSTFEYFMCDYSKRVCAHRLVVLPEQYDLLNGMTYLRSWESNFFDPQALKSFYGNLESVTCSSFIKPSLDRRQKSTNMKAFTVFSLDHDELNFCVDCFPNLELLDLGAFEGDVNWTKYTFRNLKTLKVAYNMPKFVAPKLQNLKVSYVTAKMLEYVTDNFLELEELRIDSMCLSLMECSSFWSAIGGLLKKLKTLRLLEISKCMPCFLPSFNEVLTRYGQDSGFAFDLVDRFYPDDFSDGQKVVVFKQNKIEFRYVGRPNQPRSAIKRPHANE